VLAIELLDEPEYYGGNHQHGGKLHDTSSYWRPGGAT
jgi:hypothetical protein